MTQRVRWGILGTASVTHRRFMPAILRSRNAAPVALASRDYARAQEFAANHSISVPYGSYEELLADPEVQAVYIPLPNHLHGEWTVKAAEAGKHVLCEKPMAVDAEEARRMVDACRAHGVVLMEGFMYRLNPRTLAIRRAIDDGRLGRVRSVVIQFSFLLGSRKTYRDDSRMIPGKGAGSMMDLGCYCINFARCAFGREPRSVIAIQDIDKVSGGDMSTSAVLDFGDGATALIACGFDSSYRNSICVAGDEAALQADRFFTPLDDGKTSYTIKSSHGEPQVFEFDAVNQFLLEIEHFSDCVLGRTDVILDPGADAVPNAVVIDAVRKSAAAGCPVEVLI